VVVDVGVIEAIGVDVRVVEELVVLELVWLVVVADDDEGATVLADAAATHW
jgi:hypothetical protein